MHIGVMVPAILPPLSQPVLADFGTPVCCLPFRQLPHHPKWPRRHPFLREESSEVIRRNVRSVASCIPTDPEDWRVRRK